LGAVRKVGVPRNEFGADRLTSGDGSCVRGIEECTMLGMDEVDEGLTQGLGLTTKQVEPFLRAGGDAAEMKFMECCRCLWKANGAELVEPFVDAVFNTLPEKSRCVLFQRMLTIVYVAQDSERLQRAADEARIGATAAPQDNHGAR
jgi:hypothetical protein